MPDRAEPQGPELRLPEDGQFMAASEPYTSKSSALKEVDAIKRNAADAQVDEGSGDGQDPTATSRVATPDA